MAEKREAQEGIKMPKGAIDREKWKLLEDRVERLEKQVAELVKKGPRATK